ncbi:hypothetical protein TOC8171_02570 [Pseudomonas syringae]
MTVMAREPLCSVHIRLNVAHDASVFSPGTWHNGGPLSIFTPLRLRLPDATIRYKYPLGMEVFNDESRTVGTVDPRGGMAGTKW